MKKLTYSILLIMLFIGITIIPVSAETFTDTYEETGSISGTFDTTFSAEWNSAGTPYILLPGSIGNHNGLRYIGIELSASQAQRLVIGTSSDDSTIFTCTVGGKPITGEIFWQYSRNSLGQVLNKRIWIYFDNFDTSGMSGTNVKFPLSLSEGSWSLTNRPHIGSSPTSYPTITTSYSQVITAEYNYAYTYNWENTLTANYGSSLSDFSVIKNGYSSDVWVESIDGSISYYHNYGNADLYDIPIVNSSYKISIQSPKDEIYTATLTSTSPTTSINIDIDKGSVTQSEDDYSIIKTSSATYNYPEDIIVETTNIPEESISTIGYYLFSDESGIIKDGYTYYLLANDSYRKQKYDIDTSQYITIEMISSDSISSEIDEITFDMENLDSGHYEVRARFTGYPTTYISGIGYAGEVANTYDITLHIRDAITQSGISGEYTLSEYNPESDTLEEIGSGNFAGSITWNLKPETQYSWDFESSGYRNKEFNLLATGDVQRVVYMYPEGSNYTLGFSIYETINGQETGVYGAKIDINGQIIYSNSVGSAGIELPAGNYSYTVSAEGYISQSGSVYVDEDMFISVKLSPISGEISPTPTPTPYNIDKPTNIIESVKYAFAKMFGFDGTNPEKINLLFALIIITGTASLAGTITRRGEEFISGTGVLIGAGIGFIFSIALDLIPLWILFVGIAGLIGYILFIRNKEE